MMKVARLDTYYFKWEFVSEPFDFKKWVKEKSWVYDFDQCGDEVSFWVTMKEGEPTFYRVRHDWYWHNYGLEDSEAMNDFEIRIVQKDALDKEAAKALRFVV